MSMREFVVLDKIGKLSNTTLKFRIDSKLKSENIAWKIQGQLPAPAGPFANLGFTGCSF